jgi:hypothetical protein
MNAVLKLDQAERLIHEIEQQGAAERRAIIEAAEREAAAIVRQAFAEARQRVRDELQALRRDADRRLVRAAAQFETERRRREQARHAEILHTGCPDLINIVVERWADPAARRFWIDSMAADARSRLPPGDWVIEHPADWRPEDEARLRGDLPPEVKLAFAVSDDIDAGFRIQTEGATLDCTPERLLAEKSVNQARLLAEMAAEVDNAEALARSPNPCGGAAL